LAHRKEVLLLALQGSSLSPRLFNNILREIMIKT